MNIKIKDLFKRNPGVISLKRHTKQSGRTMTEMLGVLAIIGIISITALKGFEYAMERYRENETLNRFAKVVAGARTGRLLENYGLDTVVCTDRSDETGCTRGDDRTQYRPWIISMDEVISNIGKDFGTLQKADVGYIPSDRTRTLIYGPLKGPWKNGTEQPIEIYVQIETADAFTVRARNLTRSACERIVQTQNLGYRWVYNAKNEYETNNWKTPGTARDKDVAQALCEAVVGEEPVDGVVPDNDELVLWFGDWDCMGDRCPTGPVSGTCPGNRPVMCDFGQCCASAADCDTDTLTCAGEPACLAGTTLCGESNCCNAGQICQDGECVDPIEDGVEDGEGGICATYYCAGETDFYADDENPEMRVFHTGCTKWACTDAKVVLRDPTENVANDIAAEPHPLKPNKPMPGRDLEVPLPDKPNVYSYCALEFNDKCALVTYCNEEPQAVLGMRYMQYCPSCFAGGYSEEAYDKLTQVCVGDTFKKIVSLTDGKDMLKHFEANPADHEPCYVCNGQDVYCNETGSGTGESADESEDSATNTQTCQTVNNTKVCAKQCPAGQKPYCVSDARTCDGNATIQEAETCCPYQAWAPRPFCVETACIGEDYDFLTIPGRAIQVPYRLVNDTSSAEAGLSLEVNGKWVALPKDVKAVYPYCAYARGDECLLKTFCYTEPVGYNGTTVLQQCNSCFASDSEYGSLNSDNVCLGDTFVSVYDATQTAYSLRVIARMTPKEDCMAECDCPTGHYTNEGCCETGTVWGPCGGCSKWGVYIDDWGVPHPAGDLCCNGITDAPSGCQHLIPGETAYHWYPINNMTECAAFAVASDIEI